MVRYSVRWSLTCTHYHRYYLTVERLFPVLMIPDILVQINYITIFVDAVESTNLLWTSHRCRSIGRLFGMRCQLLQYQCIVLSATFVSQAAVILPSHYLLLTSLSSLVFRIDLVILATCQDKNNLQGFLFVLEQSPFQATHNKL